MTFSEREYRNKNDRHRVSVFSYNKQRTYLLPQTLPSKPRVERVYPTPPSQPVQPTAGSGCPFSERAARFSGPPGPRTVSPPAAAPGLPCRTPPEEPAAALGSHGQDGIKGEVKDGCCFSETVAVPRPGSSRPERPPAPEPPG